MIGGIRSGSGRRRSGRFLRRRWRLRSRAASPEYLAASLNSTAEAVVSFAVRSQRRNAAPPKGVGPEAVGGGVERRGTKIPHFVRDDKGFVRDDKGFARDEKGFARNDKGFVRDDKRAEEVIDIAVVCSVDSV